MPHLDKACTHNYSNKSSLSYSSSLACLSSACPGESEVLRAGYTDSESSGSSGQLFLRPRRTAVSHQRAREDPRCRHTATKGELHKHVKKSEDNILYIVFVNQVFNEAVYHMFCSALGRKLTSEELFAVQTLTGDPSAHGTNEKAADTPSGWCVTNRVSYRSRINDSCTVWVCV